MAAGDIGYKSSVSHGTAKTGPFTKIAFAMEITAPKFTATRIDITNHDSPNRWREKRIGLRETGEVALKVLFTKTELASLMTLLLAAAMLWWEIKFPLDTGETTASKFVAQGFLADLSALMPLDEKMEAEITVVLTGEPEFTAGAP